MQHSTTIALALGTKAAAVTPAQVHGPTPHYVEFEVYNSDSCTGSSAYHMFNSDTSALGACFKLMEVFYSVRILEIYGSCVRECCN
ncbi:Uu.00g129020.m01.CDS01 [Anthostomella pinea]|uniref:Uu.00g129020.m01.CDS01 n=1 Tax=Anthostomella pinea TaxID=933095 RepID=A0AAI8VIF8_9PEZI|nr:Uu.00g129020.m01.CDS01 [Anthostomella pinea]